MHFTEFFAITERYQDILNPSSTDKLLLLGEYCEVKQGSRVLDIGCGKGYLLRLWAERYGATGVGIDVNPVSIREAREKAEAAGLSDSLEFLEMPALEYDNPEAFDVVTCIGAPFAIGSFAKAVAWLAKRVKSDGNIAIGDEYLPAPLPQHVSENADSYQTLPEMAAVFEKEGLFTTGIIAASQDDWDRYASGGWRAACDWLRNNPEHPHYAEVKERVETGRETHLSFFRQYVGWAMLAGRKVG